LTGFPYLGHGVGLRVPHYQRALRGALEVDWVEVVTENFFGAGGRPRAVLEAVRRERPLVFHGVSLGVGSLGMPDRQYLRQVKELADAFEPAWLSDHVCWTRFEGHYAHELLPLPFTSTALDVAVENTLRAQDYLQRPLVLENVSSYVTYRADEMSEWEFLGALARRSGCALLLDLNNVLVSAHNHGFEPSDYLAGLPPDRVVQFHLANHTQHVGHKFDDHRGPVPQVVWELFETALRRFGEVSSLVEWDEELPAWEVLVAERDQAAARARKLAGDGSSRMVGEVLPEGASDGSPRSSDVLPSDASPSVERSPGARRGLTGASGGAVLPQSRAPKPRGAVRQRPPVHELERAQRLFMRALTWPRGVRDFVESAEGDARRALEATFARPETANEPRFDHIARLDIYANAYFYRLLDALRELFPRLAGLAGDVPFHNLATDYLLEHPSTAPDLRRLGDRLPAFLRGHRTGQGTLLLCEVADLEHALAFALDAPDAPEGQCLTRADLVRRAPHEWPILELTFAPSTLLVSATHDLERIARLCDERQHECALATPSGEEARPVLVSRRGHAVYFRHLERLEAFALEKIKGGARFDNLCGAFGQTHAEPAQLVDFLMRWVDDGVIMEGPRRGSAGTSTS
jgi:uncharacterized protein (UPF0276 family)